uniref:Serine/arginine repetitive matrix protein putative n=1 Tax=Albugo laibachii Nc14 TaxID=890382 RepID=F0WLW7_9STRA|nr:serine/arginine repetitive matrix protein putative [Albugo laibachii Nc14]|eukprot:CCA22294.1 serine/arginine repetitive matrix protein putative [Albugo laibachii Nc14]
MSNAGFFRGTSTEQDSRYFNQNKKLLAKLKFPKCFDDKVDLKKVKIEVINQWIAERITSILGFEDEIVISMTINLLETKVDEPVNPREMQLALAGFLEKDAASFMQDLWELLLSAQSHPTGIAPAILEKKRKELEKQGVEREKVRSILQKKRDSEQKERKDLLQVNDDKRTRDGSRQRSSHHQRSSESRVRKRNRRRDSSSSSSFSSSASSNASHKSSSSSNASHTSRSRSRSKTYSRYRRQRYLCRKWLSANADMSSCVASVLAIAIRVVVAEITNTTEGDFQCRCVILPANRILHFPLLSIFAASSFLQSDSLTR